MKKNNKGFTLVEMLVVIALIAVISTGIAIGMFGMLDDQRSNLTDIEIENIENAACTYAETNDLREKCNSDSSLCEISVSNLILWGYLDEDLEYSGVVKVSWPNDVKTCEFEESMED